MNYTLLKDAKAMSGFISAIVLSIIGIGLAMKDNSYWVFFIVISFVILMVSVFRADKLYQGKGR
ncbi:hypothetical protein JSQ81_11555 [Sporosarcina sp. Marseille-Q4063]|uniref:hypothetical protein n=1 Tax=Sporosarcina sp. Marseille-Q4063 TaxID=2810514 RepID=UPI001BB05C9F|nr:hypothetical protein [Sporosarcina sp. Marseille-Q4063]QUW20496.1 hypothetical protein JSQ81_11555 [Sporosarcina sp. Marseille-Q4063]